MAATVTIEPTTTLAELEQLVRALLRAEEAEGDVERLVLLRRGRQRLEAELSQLLAAA